MKLKVKTGKTYGFLTVLRRDKKRLDRVYWICKCSCGVKKSVRSDKLGKSTVSCGHYNRELIQKAREGTSSTLFRSNKKRFRYYLAVKPLYDRIRERDGNCCVLCRTRKKLHVHHILRKSKYKQYLFEPANLVTLCEKCHLYDAHRGNTNDIDLKVASALLETVYYNELDLPTPEVLVTNVIALTKDLLA